MRFLSLVVFVFFAWSSYSQESPSKLRINGYVKNLQSLINPNDLDLLQTLNFVHHRMNLRYDVNDRWSLQAGNRNRVFTGSLLLFNPNFGDQLNRESDDYLKLSSAWVNRRGLVAHSTFDRLFIRYSHERLEVTLGRQRINWGINTLWNPNDLYNTFNFTDFDYEERPGSDALRIKYYTGDFSSMELAAKMGPTVDSTVLGMMYKTHLGLYDLQVLGAYYYSEWALGMGWAGSLGQLGFKGEATGFFPQASEEDPIHLSANTGIEYIAPGNLLLSLGVLYNSSGSERASLTQLINAEITAKNLYPYRWALAATLFKSINPLVNIGGSLIYSPNEFHPVFLVPTLGYSIKENWDIDMIGQIILQKDAQKYQSPGQLIFLRLKWSY
jgi:hypothetical protein